MKKALAFMLIAFLPVAIHAETFSGPQPSVVGTAAVGQIPGTATNDSAAAGKVGEDIQSDIPAGSAVSISASGNTVNVTSISLTAGNWLIWGNVWYAFGGSTLPTQLSGAVSTTTATMPTAPALGARTQIFATFPAGSSQGTYVGSMTMQLSATTTVFLVCTAQFTVSTAACYGHLEAIRIR